MLGDIFWWALGVLVGIALGPLAWRFGYRTHAYTGDSVVAKPWSRPQAGWGV